MRAAFASAVVMTASPRRAHSAEEVLALAADAPLAVVKVSASGCRACARVRRPFERAAVAHAARARFAELIVARDDDGARTLCALGVRSVPTFIVFRAGRRVDHFSTSCPDALADHLRDWL